MARRIKYSFKQWCEDNNRQDLLNRWDYEATGFLPDEIAFASAKPVYFKCPKGLHESEKKKVYVITSGSQNNFICKECNEIFRHDIKDMTNMKFGKLTVLSIDIERTKKQKEAYWICKCSCGKTKSIRGASLRSGVIVTCGDRKIHWTGKNASNWRGGVTPINIAIRNSEEYDVWRENILKKDNYKCVICGTNHKLEAHHIYPFSSYIEKRFDLNCGITLCYDHHSMYAFDSFHKAYGTYDNTPEQLNEYINRKRTELGFTEPFDIYKYMNCLSSADLPYPDELPPDLDSTTNIA